MAGVGQIKIKDHLSPAEAETWAELGKNKAYICRGNRQQHLYNFRENYIYELKGKAHTSKSKNLNLLGGRGLFCDLSRSCHIKNRIDSGRKIIMAPLQIKIL